ncbi:hypothetical protein EDM02_04165 [Candidatus Cardinium hertigii]|uniref:AAA-ATPase-like domain-containing protein n=2 Tax=Candidatus Cardinium hertigii TaxID=247481 RepID=A0A3N2QBP1_9BACT|nr:hypothetical protein EDM02_04165 [Candidatus Cardinium hertigii]
MMATTLSPRIRTGTDDFKNLLLHSDVFVDKSLLIQELLTESSEVILITRPRRWGKSLNMDMIRKFFELEVNKQGDPLPKTAKLNHLLFIGGEVNVGFDETTILHPLKIADNSYAIKRQGQFPVMVLNLKDVKGSNDQEIETGIGIALKNTYNQHDYLLHSTSINLHDKKGFQIYLNEEATKPYLKQGLRFLSELLYKHFNQKVYMLIDEYDTPINHAYIKFGHQSDVFDSVLELFRGILGSALKSNPYLEKGLITGILRIAKANLFSDLNNIREYTLLDKRYASFYGFTQAEVDTLLTQVATETAPATIQDWYNGYSFGGEIIYNPWSIMQCLASQGTLDYYWLDSGGTGLIDKAWLADEMQEDLQALVMGKAITSPITKQISFPDIDKPIGLLSLLLFSGYLNPMPYQVEEHIYQLSIPNKEIAYIYKARMLQWVTNQLHMDRSSYYAFVHLLPAGHIEAFKEKLQTLLQTATSFYQTGSAKAELFYSGFMLGMLHMLASEYTIESEIETGSGRADMLLIPQIGKQSNALIIEYKIAKDPINLDKMAQAGLAQIQDRQYASKIKRHLHVKKITKLAFAFCGKEVAVAYQVDNL